MSWLNTLRAALALKLTRTSGFGHEPLTAADIPEPRRAPLERQARRALIRRIGARQARIAIKAARRLGITPAEAHAARHGFLPREAFGRYLDARSPV